MIKFKSIKFIGHPVLGDLYIDFTLPNGNTADTVIFAGENGTGKSTILEILYTIAVNQEFPQFQVECELEDDSLFADNTIKFAFIKRNNHIEKTILQEPLGVNLNWRNRFSTSCIFSDTNINFHSEPVSTVTSQNLDTTVRCKKSEANIAQQIKQMLVDIQALDDSDLASEYRKKKENKEDLNEIVIEERLNRFKKAFNLMFDDLKYDKVTNQNGSKVILFSKYGAEFPIDNLSSGEKQVVYRGCFLLRDKNSMKGAIVFIDEPEISMHPNWQKKIMNFYCNIFKDDDDKQTSQIFAVTHSPFIIHDSNLTKAKIIVLKRDCDGKIIVSDKPEYYKCDGIEAIKEAFDIEDFNPTKSYVFLEGRTDEMYFRKAVEVFGHNDLPFEFKWIGHMEKGQEANTGYKSLDAAFNFLKGNSPDIKCVCLYDCDTKKPYERFKNIHKLSLQCFANNSNIKRGIENSLILDTIDLKSYYRTKCETSDYGEKKEFQEFLKMDLCEHICSLNKENQKEILCNLNNQIEKLKELLS